MFPGKELPTPLSQQLLHDSIISDRDKLILNPPDEDLQGELNAVLLESLPPPALTTGAELTLELIKGILRKTEADHLTTQGHMYAGESFITNYLEYLDTILKPLMTESQIEGLLQMWDRVTNWIIYAKYTHLRPRPIELAAAHDLVLEVHEPFIENSWSRTPSYPSLRFGLALSAAHYISHSHPRYFQVLRQKAGDIGTYLLEAHCNYPSDLQAIPELFEGNILSSDNLIAQTKRSKSQQRRAARRIRNAKAQKRPKPHEAAKKRWHSSTKDSVDYVRHISRRRI
jgi:hypothetical protein